MLFELPLSVRLPDAVSASPMLKGMAIVEVFWLIVVFTISVIVGAVLEVLTVNRNVSLVVAMPSLTFTVIVADPV